MDPLIGTGATFRPRPRIIAIAFIAIFAVAAISLALWTFRTRHEGVIITRSIPNGLHPRRHFSKSADGHFKLLLQTVRSMDLRGPGPLAPDPYEIVTDALTVHVNWSADVDRGVGVLGQDADGRWQTWWFTPDECDVHRFSDPPQCTLDWGTTRRAEAVPEDLVYQDGRVAADPEAPRFAQVDWIRGRLRSVSDKRRIYGDSPQPNVIGSLAEGCENLSKLSRKFSEPDLRALAEASVIARSLLVNSKTLEAIAKDIQTLHVLLDDICNP